MSAKIEAGTVAVQVTGAVGRVTLNRPERMNAVTVELGAALERALQTMAARDDVNVVVISGAGGNFCSGGDFDEVQRLRTQGDLAPLFENFARACQIIADMPQPVVAAVEGVAMAGGFELIQAVDVALVAENAKLCDNHVNFGMIPGGGGSQRLPRLIGRPRALGHLLSGQRISGIEAERWGLIFKALPPATFEVEVAAFVAQLAQRSRDSLVKIKRLVRTGLDGPLGEGLQREQTEVIAHIAGAEPFTRKGAAS